MRLRSFLVYLSLLPLGACTRACHDYDNNEEFARAQLPPYSATGANTLGCVLGAQPWTVLGRSFFTAHYGGEWRPNVLRTSIRHGPPLPLLLLTASGRMTGVRDSKEFYDTELQLSFALTDTLGGLRLLGGDSTSFATGEPEQLSAYNWLDGRSFSARRRRPVRLLIRQLDRQQRIVSGTFAGMLYENRGRDSLAVADGRFDLRY